MEWKGIRGQVLKNVPMKRYTSMKVGGPVRYMAYPIDSDDLSSVIGIAEKKSISRRLFGNGTNIIVSDRGLDDLIIRMTRVRQMHFRKTNRGALVEVGGGTSLARLIRESVERGLSGLEKLYGIPGTVAGAIKMNGGSFGVQISDHLRTVTYMDSSRQIKERDRETCGFGYRSSLFTSSESILSALFELHEGDRANLKKEKEHVWAERCKKHPMEFPSAGSVFKNINGEPAWKYIDKAGLRGFRIGNAAISEKHPNFIVNLGNATAADVVNLIRKAKKEVYERVGVRMEEEVELWGCDG
ncbi:MAG TPA: UDP-N-acetylmuramate dehydrogenase [Syntrophorhabdales bacterium]|nr:UDP-N-acetylmuramate dehydrogenase [Syntrophorhabdales bacterium]